MPRKRSNCGSGGRIAIESFILDFLAGNLCWMKTSFPEPVTEASFSERDSGCSTKLGCGAWSEQVDVMLCLRTSVIGALDGKRS